MPFYSSRARPYKEDLFPTRKSMICYLDVVRKFVCSHTPGMAHHITHPVFGSL